MTLGNGLALVQTNTKRLLAYSSIAHVGYFMLTTGIGLRYDIPLAMQAGFFLLLAHAAMKGLAFLCKGVCYFYFNATTIDQLRGTAARLPLVAAAFTVAVAGLAGVPPLAGFASKWFVLTGGLRSADAVGYVGMAVFLVNSLLSLGYYLPLIGTLFAPGNPEVLEDLEDSPRMRVSLWIALPLAVLSGLVLGMGLNPEPWLDWTAAAGHYVGAVGR
jgi:NADH:ubiquinone oxidoreductase subunit 2 (subunit N)